MIFPLKRVKEELERGYLRDTCLTGGSKTCLFSDRFFFRAREPVKIQSEAECFHNKPPAMRVVGQCL